jgi:hypothetical protein
MIRVVCALSLWAVCVVAAVAQVPAGIPYDPAVHPNPIITWVRNQDFKSTSFAEAEQLIGVEMMGLSSDEGKREALHVAMPQQNPRRVRILDSEVEVTFYAVARQTYRLKSGQTFTLYTFRFPRALTTADALNDTAFRKPRRPSDARFGPTPVPDRLDIRGFPGLLFDAGKERTIYWFERGAGHSVTTDASKDELFRVLEDLL